MHNTGNFRMKLLGAIMIVLGIALLVPFAILGLIPFTLFVLGFGFMVGGGSAAFLKEEYID
ncbi:MAG: hypothetical protein ACOCTT_02315 [archaeon]